MGFSEMNSRDIAMAKEGKERVQVLVEKAVAFLQKDKSQMSSDQIQAEAETIISQIKPALAVAKENSRIDESLSALRTMQSELMQCSADPTGYEYLLGDEEAAPEERMAA